MDIALQLERVHTTIFDPNGGYATGWYDCHHVSELFLERADLEQIYHTELEILFVSAFEQYPAELKTTLRETLIPHLPEMVILDIAAMQSEYGEEIYAYTSAVHRYILRCMSVCA